MAVGTDRELLAGRYRRVRTIGRGGMAQVILAEDERLGRRVAVKRLHTPGLEEPAARFEREARLGAALNHPNLVSVYDVAADGESVLIIMEYVEGDTLKAAIAGGPLEPERVCPIIADVAGALDEAHAHGVVHRDVKPGNILLRHDGVTKLADLGIATAANSTKITGTGIVLGTASYMAPEQIDGQEAGPPADVYALAAVAYEALAGRKAREGASPVEVAHRVVGDPPPDLRAARPDLPADAADVLMRGMALDPRERPASAGELAKDLADALARRRRTAPASAAAAAPAEVPERRPDFTTHRRGLPSWVPAAAALAVVAALAAGGFALLGGGGEDPAPREPAAERPAAKRNGVDRKARPQRPAAPAPQGGSGAAAPQPAQPAPAASGGAVPARLANAGPSALDREGARLTRAGRYDEAIPILRRAVATAPRDQLVYAYALFNLGRALRLSGRPDEAVPILERRLAIPNQTDTVRAELDRARAAASRQ